MRHSFPKITSVIRSSRTPICLLWIILITAHLFLPTDGGDDAWFGQILSGELATLPNWTSFLIERYHTWSSRVAIEGLLILLVRFPILWRVSNSVICILLTVAAKRLFNPEGSRAKNWILFAIFFLFPLGIFYEVGYVATTLNYLWPLCAIFWAILPTAKAFLGRHVAAWEYAVAIFALLFAAFQEQACAVLLALYLGGACYLAIAKKRVDLFGSIAVCVCIAFLIYTFTCPGNQNRFSLEEAANFPNFSSLSMLQKIEIGFSSMMQASFLSLNVFTALFCLLVSIAAFFKKTKTHVRVLSLLPTSVAMLCGVLGSALEAVCPPILVLRSSVGQTGTAPTWHSPISWLPLILFVLLLAIILYALFALIPNRKLYWLFAFLLSVGAASRIAIGLSPTVWASGERTCTFFYAALAIVAANLLYTVVSERSDVCRKKQSLDIPNS